MKYLVAGITLLVACSAVLALQDRAPRHVIEIEGMRYTPASITITVGETVTWRNIDDRDHTVKAEDGSFESGTIRSKETYSFRFRRAGTYRYACGFHPRMKGTIVVQSNEDARPAASP